MTNTDVKEQREYLKKLIAQEHIRVVHLFDKDFPYGGCTIAYRPERHDNSGFPTGRFARVSVAYCSPSDRYSRRTGEAIAVGKLIGNESVLMPIYRNKHPVKNLKSIFSDILQADYSAENFHFDASHKDTNWPW